VLMGFDLSMMDKLPRSRPIVRWLTPSCVAICSIVKPRLAHRKPVHARSGRTPELCRYRHLHNTAGPYRSTHRVKGPASAERFQRALNKPPQHRTKRSKPLKLKKKEKPGKR